MEVVRIPVEIFCQRGTSLAARRQMLEAYNDFLIHGLPKGVADVSSFIKTDELLPDDGSNKGHEYDPRLIQGAAKPLIKVLVGREIVPVSDELKKQWSVDAKITYSSGLTPEGVGRWMEVVVETFHEPFFIEVDFYRWDCHLGEGACGTEQIVYKRVFNISKIAQHCLKCQLHTRGRTRFGIEYRVDYTRRSGDSNTSVGNSLLNGGLHGYFFETMFLGKFKVIVLGDDMLCAVDRSVARHWDQGAYEVFVRSLGLEPEIKTHEQAHSASFCSSYFYPIVKVGPQPRLTYVLAPKMGRVLSKWGYAIGRPVKGDSQLLAGEIISSLPHGWVVPGFCELISRYNVGGRYTMPKWNRPLDSPLMFWGKPDQLSDYYRFDGRYHDMIAFIYSCSRAHLNQMTRDCRSFAAAFALSCE